MTPTTDDDNNDDNDDDDAGNIDDGLPDLAPYVDVSSDVNALTVVIGGGSIDVDVVVVAFVVEVVVVVVVVVLVVIVVVKIDVVVPGWKFFFKKVLMSVSISLFE